MVKASNMGNATSQPPGQRIGAIVYREQIDARHQDIAPKIELRTTILGRPSAFSAGANNI